MVRNILRLQDAIKLACIFASQDDCDYFVRVDLTIREPQPSDIQGEPRYEVTRDSDGGFYCAEPCAESDIIAGTLKTVRSPFHTCPVCETNFKLVGGAFPAHRFNGQICPEE